MADELTKALLVEEVVSPHAIADALFASVTTGVPLVHALIDSGAATPEVLARYLARSPAPVLRQVAPLTDLVDRLPAGLCERLMAIPVRRDAITGTVDVAVVNGDDPHPAREIGFHLGAPIRVIRAPLSAIDEALRRLRARSVPPKRPVPAAPAARMMTLPPPSFRPAPVAAEPPAAESARRSGGRRATPPWGTPVQSPAQTKRDSELPRSRPGSEIPIPLTRKTYAADRGGTQRPLPMVNPVDAQLGEGIPVDPIALRTVVEERTEAREIAVDVGAIVDALHVAGTRDEILELVLAGGRSVAANIAVFVVKRGAYAGWSCTPEFGEVAQVQKIAVPVDAESAFRSAVESGLYLGSLRAAPVHAELLRVMGGGSDDVALVPIRVAGKPAAMIVADELGDTMRGTQRLQEIARAAGDAFARIVRTRR